MIRTKSGYGFAIAFAFLATAFFGCCKTSSPGEFNPSQTSAAMLFRYAQTLEQSAPPEKKADAALRQVLLGDIYIKARTYAMLNKTFFWLSLFFAMGVLLWPSLGIIFKARLQDVEWVKSAIVQTTITGLAALMFTFYSQYKDKQTSAETLMRYVLYSRLSASDLAIKVSDEIASIDHGFTFNSLVGDKKPQASDSVSAP